MTSHFSFFLLCFLTVTNVQAALLPPLAAEPLAEALKGAYALGDTLAGTRAQSPWSPLIARLAADGFGQREVEKLFIQLGRPPIPLFMAEKVVELAALQKMSGVAYSAPPEEATSFAPPDYQRLAGGLSAAAGQAFMDRHAKLFAAAYKRYGVPAPFITAVLMVETGLGAELGRHSALHTLASMAVYDTLNSMLPFLHGVSGQEAMLVKAVSEKAAWAYNELKALLHCRIHLGQDLIKVPSSVYGAVGLCQFMPSSILIYGVDADDDGRIDLFKLPDAVYSIAYYLSAHGWKKALTPSAQIQVLRSYNHSDLYASTVYGVAMQIISPGTFMGAKHIEKDGDAVRAARAGTSGALPPNRMSQRTKSGKMSITLPAYDLEQPKPPLFP